MTPVYSVKIPLCNFIIPYFSLVRTLKVYQVFFYIHTYVSVPISSTFYNCKPLTPYVLEKYWNILTYLNVEKHSDFNTVLFFDFHFLHDIVFSSNYYLTWWNFNPWRSFYRNFHFTFNTSTSFLNVVDINCFLIIGLILL